MYLVVIYVSACVSDLCFLDVAGSTLVAVHYSINSQLSGDEAGTYNYDISCKTGMLDNK